MQYAWKNDKNIVSLQHKQSHLDMKTIILNQRKERDELMSRTYLNATVQP